MSYGEPNNRGALEQVNEARERATTAVSEMRQRGASSHHPNLSPADGRGRELATVATQAVADYLLQLRPYRATSKSWDVNFGGVELPTTVAGESNKRIGHNMDLPLFLCRQPFIPIRNVSELIKAANMTIQYSSVKQTQKSSRNEGRRSSSNPNYLVRTNQYGEIQLRSEDAFRAVLSGATTVEEAIEAGSVVFDDEPEEEDEPEYIPGDPNVESLPGDTRGTDDKLKTFNLVFPAQTLLSFVELADEVAAEMNLLIELDTPAAQDGGGF